MLKKKLTKEHREKLRKSHLGKKFSEETKKKMSESRMGHKTSVKTRKKIGDAQRGKKSHVWKDGLSVLNPSKYERNRIMTKQEKMAGSKRPKQCEICGAMGRICFDHNHETGKFRGWICLRCNFAIGLVKDNIELLDSMIKYLMK